VAHVSQQINLAILAARCQGAVFLLTGAALVLVVAAAVDQGYWFTGSRLPFVLSVVFYFAVGALFLFLAAKMESAALWTFVVAVTVASILTLLLLVTLFLGGVLGPCCSHPVLVLSSIHVIVRCCWAFPELRFYDPARRGLVKRAGFQPIVKAPETGPPPRPPPTRPDETRARSPRE
jgi:hypothetical protein